MRRMLVCVGAVGVLLAGCAAPTEGAASGGGEAASPAASSAGTKEAKKADPAVPAEHRAALEKAQDYAETMHMSKAAVREQLTSEYGEKFPKDAADYAMANVKADWKANALAKAKDYRETMHMSDSAIRDQLTSEHGEKFTKAEAAWAMEHLDG